MWQLGHIEQTLRTETATPESSGADAKRCGHLTFMNHEPGLITVLIGAAGRTGAEGRRDERAAAGRRTGRPHGRVQVKRPSAGKRGILPPGGRHSRHRWLVM